MTEMWSLMKEKLFSQFKEWEKDYSNLYKRATASYLCNTIARQCFKGCLLGPNCCYGNGTVLLKGPLKVVA